MPACSDGPLWECQRTICQVFSSSSFSHYEPMQRDALRVEGWFLSRSVFQLHWKGTACSDLWQKNCNTDFNNMEGFTVLQKSNSHNVEESSKWREKINHKFLFINGVGCSQNWAEDQKGNLWARKVSSWAGDWSWYMTVLILRTYCKSQPFLSSWLILAAALSSIFVINLEWNGSL